MIIGCYFGFPQFVIASPLRTDVSGTISASTTWTAAGNPYVINGSVTIAQNVTLTIQPGVVIKLNPGSSIGVNGTLRSEGTAESPVTITSLKDDSVGGDSNNDGTATAPAKGDWATIGVSSSGILTLNHTHIRYGGRNGANVYGLVEINGNGQATIANSILTESYGYGIKLQPNGNSLVATLTLNDSIIENNRFDGIYAYANNGATNQVAITNATVRNNGNNGVQLNTVANGIIVNSAIYGNTSAGVWNGTIAQPIDARNNWWGDPSGPNHPEQNPNGQGQSVSDGILFNPWLIVPPSGDGSNNETALTIGESKTFAMQPPLYAVFTVETEPAKNLLLTIDIGEGQLPPDAGIIRVLTSRGRIATSYAFESVAEVDAGERHVELAIQNTLGGQYYVVVGLPFTVQSEVNATILAQYVALHITDVSPDEAGNAGDVTLTIDGAGFTNNVEATLISPTGQRVNSKETIVGASGQVFATFDLHGAELGTYSIELKDLATNATTMKSDTVAVKQGEAGRLKLHLEGPTSVRPGRIYSYKLVYENAGDADMVAPFVSIYTDDPGGLFYSNGYTSTQSLTWLAAGTNSRGDLLPSGARGVVDFQANFQNSVKLSIGAISEGEVEFEWRRLQARFETMNVPEEIWSKAESIFGITPVAILNNLKLLNQNRQGAVSLDTLMELALWTAANQSDAVQAAYAHDDFTGVDYYDYRSAKEDVKLYVFDKETQSFIHMADSSSEYFDTDKPAIIITHGWRDGKTDRFLGMAKQLSRDDNYGNSHNIVFVQWAIGAASPPTCQFRLANYAPGGRIIFGNASPLCAQIVSTRIRSVATVAYTVLRDQQNYTTWKDTLYIGHSFGNAVNARISTLASYVDPSNKGRALLLNPASDGGFWHENSAERDYEAAFSKSTAIYTYDVADSKFALKSHYAVQYEVPLYCGIGGLLPCHPLGKAHGSGIPLLTCWLMAQSETEDCGPIAKGKHALAKAFIEGNLQLKPGCPYVVTASGELKLGDIVCYGAFGPNQGIEAYTLISLNSTQVQNGQSISVVRSSDPNDKIGPTGHGNQNVVSSDSTLNYTINFENMATATAPVQELRITDQLDPNLDWSTFQFTAISYGDRVLPISTGPGILEYAAQDYPPTAVIAGTTEGDMRIDIEAKLNIQTGMVEWYLKAVDDATGDFPLDALAGILPPEDGSGRGQGYVMFSIQPKAETPLGASVRNKASIVFDTNEAIATNEVSNIIGEAVDLVVQGSGPATATVNSEINHTFTVINDGPQNATGVSLNYTLPVGSEFIAATTGQGTCSSIVPVTCNLGTINNGARTTVTLKIRPTISGTLESSAVATTGVIEINAVDNSAKIRTATIAQPPVEQPQYTLTTNTIGDGSISTDPPGPYAGGTQVQLTATPAAGWRFVRWESTSTLGDQATQPVITMTVTANATYTAYFEQVDPAPPTHTIYLPLIAR